MDILDNLGSLPVSQCVFLQTESLIMVKNSSQQFKLGYSLYDDTKQRRQPSFFYLAIY